MSLHLGKVKKTLGEDIGKGDITSRLVIPKEKKAGAVIITREACVVCGLDIAKAVFKSRDKTTTFATRTKDGKVLKKGAVLAKIEGKAVSILAAERVALNFLTLLSGIATKTREFVKAVRPYKVKILDTRKTIPGLRKLQKYAVRKGGGYNHRMGLSDMVLIKDNHIKIAESHSLRAANITRLINGARKKFGKKIKIEIEVKSLREFKEALKAKPDMIMLDNMHVRDVKKAVKMNRDKRYAKSNTLLEASGGITLKNVRKVASTGIDMISVGELTHSVKSIDMSLEIL